MKRILIFSLLFFPEKNFFGQDAKIVLEGAYEGKNIYVQNPFSQDTSLGKFCTKKVLVNGQEFAFEEAAAFEIKLSGLGLKEGDPLKIEIFHLNDCKPKILYQYDHRPKATFEIVSIEADTGGLLKWKTKKENNRLIFYVEQFRWNKWIKIGEVTGKGGYGENEYTFQVAPNSGENKVRVKQADYSSSGPRTSDAVIFISPVKKITLDSKTITKEISLSGETLYELYDESGNIVKRGTGKTIDCSKIRKGKYFLNYDNASEKIIKK